MLLFCSQNLSKLMLVCGLFIMFSCAEKSKDPAPSSTVQLPATVVNKTYTGDVTYTSSNSTPIAAQGDGKIIRHNSHIST